MKKFDMKLTYDNQNIYIYNPTPMQLEKLKDISQFKMKGYKFAPKYKLGVWDGYIKFLSYSKKDGCFKLPVGFLNQIERIYYNEKILYKFDRRQKEANLYRIKNLEFRRELRNYQQECVNATKKNNSGVIKMPVRSGKTTVAAGIIFDKKIRTLFVVPNVTLLNQTVNEFQDIFNIEIGKIGENIWDPKDITVATIQTVTSMFDKLEMQKIFKKTHMLIIDECISGDSKIWVPNGLKMMKDIVIGDKVLTFDGKTANVIDKWVVKNKEAFLYRLKNGYEIIASEDHIVLTGSKLKNGRFFIDKNERLKNSKLPFYEERIKNVKDFVISKGFIEYNKIIDIVSLKEVIPLGKMDLYDIKIDNEDKSFIANGIVVKNCHHMKAQNWSKITQLNVEYKYGLSATVWLEINDENPTEMIWLRATIGEIIYEIPYQKLIEYKQIVKPTIYFVVIKTGLKIKGWNKEFLKEVFTSPKRNEIFLDIANSFHKNGHRVLMLTSRIDQLEILKLESQIRGIKLKALCGEDKGELRTEIINRLNIRNFILAGTIFGEGVNIPILDVVLNLEGGSSQIKTFQRLRNLTKIDKKKEAIVIDFIDEDNKYLLTQGLNRIDQLKNEEGFEVIVMDLKDFKEEFEIGD